MRVLHVGLGPNKGGVESFALNYFTALCDGGISFDFADIYGEGIAASDELRALGGKIISLPNFKRHPIKCKRALTEYLKNNPYDAVHIHITSELGIIPPLAAKAAGITPILHLHFSKNNGLFRKIIHFFTARVFRRTPAVRLACTEKSGEWFFGKGKFRVFRNAIYAKKFSFCKEAREKKREELGADRDTLLIGFVSRLEQVKNPLFALDIISRLKEECGDKKLKLVMIGDGSLSSAVKSRANALFPDGEVIQLGFKSDVSPYLSALDALIMPSLHEAQSLTALEAQANGLPCLLSDGASPENKLTERCRLLSLDDPDRWVLELSRLEVRDGSLDYKNEILNSSYDIEASREELIKIYNFSGEA